MQIGVLPDGAAAPKVRFFGAGEGWIASPAAPSSSKIEHRNRSVVLKIGNTLKIEGSNKPALMAQCRTLRTRHKAG
jgi:hypothetical protein